MEVKPYTTQPKLTTEEALLAREREWLKQYEQWLGGAPSMPRVVGHAQHAEVLRILFRQKS